MQAIESKGSIDKNGNLLLDDSLSVINKRVKVVVLIPDEDLSDKQWIQSVKHNDVFRFLDDPGEGIYLASDGEPINDEV